MREEYEYGDRSLEVSQGAPVEAMSQPQDPPLNAPADATIAMPEHHSQPAPEAVIPAPEDVTPAGGEAPQAPEVPVNPAALPLFKRLDKTMMTALITFWLAVGSYIGWAIISSTSTAETSVWDTVLFYSHWVFWVIAAISSSAALLFASWRERFAAILLLTIVAVNLTLTVISPVTGTNGWVYRALRVVLDVNLLAAATYIATRKPRPRI